MEAISEVLGSYHPESGPEFREFFEGMPGTFRQFAADLAGVGDRLGESPINAPVLEALKEAAATLAGIADQFDEVKATFQSEHEHELKRYDDPRPDEKAWDVQNADD
jgi:hypothetical protein